MTDSPVIVRHTSGERPAAGEVRVAALQYGATTDVARNLAKTLEMIDLAAAEKADVAITVEFANHVSWYENREQVHEAAIKLDGEWIEKVGARAKQHGMWIVLNGIVQRSPERVTGSNLMFSPEGELVAQSSKQVLMGSERDHFDPGDEVTPLVETPLGTTGMYSCMDGVINETPRSLAVRGARVLLNTINSFAPDEAGLHVPVRAAENKVWVVSANKVDFLVPEGPLVTKVAEALMADEDTLRGSGESMVVAPDGTIVAVAPKRGEAVLVVDIDPSLADDKKRPDGTDVMAARRPEIYGPLAEAPKGRQHGAGAAAVKAAVVQPSVDGEEALAEAAELVSQAVADGAQLVVLPELFCFPNGLNDKKSGFGMVALLGFRAIEALQKAVGDSDAVVVTSLPHEGWHHGVVISKDGVIHRQPQLHRIERHQLWTDYVGDGIEVLQLPWGRLAVVVGDDAIFPETFRLAALQDADVVAVPFDVQERWEIEYGLLERAAENRVNLVAASRPRSGLGASIVVPLEDFGMWRQDRKERFDGVISCPKPVVVEPRPGVTVVEIHPSEATNRMVTKATDLVDGRPWNLLEGVVG
jgi:predicted amidohydrolase